MTGDDIHSLQTFIVYLLAACFMAGCIGVWVALAVRRVCFWAGSMFRRRAAQERMDRVFGKVGEP